MRLSRLPNRLSITIILDYFLTKPVHFTIMEIVCKVHLRYREVHSDISKDNLEQTNNFRFSQHKHEFPISE